MTDDMIPMEEEVTEAGRTFTERVQVSGGELVQTVQGLLREAAVRRITIQDKDGRTLLEIPLYAGVAGALILGWATALALIAAWFAQVSIIIERDKSADRGPTVVGEAVEKAAGGAQTAMAQVVASVSGFLGSAGRGASDAARRAAEALEARLSSASEATDDAAVDVADAADAAAAKVGEAADAAAAKVGQAAGAVATKAGEAADAVAEATHADQCAAITKAGTRCKRPALEGSEFCSIHQVA